MRLPTIATLLGSAALSVLVTSTGAPAFAQASGEAGTAGRIIRPNAIIHTVSDLDRSTAFYRDAVGLELDSSPALPSGSSQQMGLLMNAPGADVRTATFKIPGTEVRLVLMQVSKVDARKIVSRIQDPGVVKLVLRVRDMDAQFSRVRDHITGVYTSGGGPIRPEGPNGRNQAVITKDPDGCALEFVYQPNPPLADTLPADSNVVGGWGSFVVADLAKTIDFYRGSLGFAINGSGRPASAMLLALEGTPQATTTVSTGSRPPGAAYTWFMYDFRGIERNTLPTRLQDPGTAAVSFLVDDVGALVSRLKAGGTRVETRGGEPVTVDGTRRVFVRDPSGILLEFVEAHGAAQAAAR